MPAFGRSFAFEVLRSWDEEHAGNAVRSLFDRWALPGNPSTSGRSLRLGVRDGYLNFYVKGQSVAKLTCGASGPKLFVHNAYAGGQASEHGNEVLPEARDYRTYDSSALAQAATSMLLPRWITTAETYASAEKRFVDELVAANPGVIDLEMGLPASDLPGSPRIAPRMDLAVIQVTEHEPPAVAFWEAKCANNPELRSSRPYVELADGGFTGPRVISQLGKYKRWMSENDRVDQVAKAYRQTATLMTRFHDLFSHSDGEVPRCLSYWRALSACERPAVVVEPGLVVGNYWPDGTENSGENERMAQCAASFARNGHRQALDSRGIFVHEVGPDHRGPKLPPLPCSTMSA